MNLITFLIFLVAVIFISTEAVDSTEQGLESTHKLHHNNDVDEHHTTSDVDIKEGENVVPNHEKIRVETLKEQIDDATHIDNNVPDIIPPNKVDVITHIEEDTEHVSNDMKEDMNSANEPELKSSEKPEVTDSEAHSVDEDIQELKGATIESGNLTTEHRKASEAHLDHLIDDENDPNLKKNENAQTVISSESEPEPTLEETKIEPQTNVNSSNEHEQGADAEKEESNESTSAVNTNKQNETEKSSKSLDEHQEMHSNEKNDSTTLEKSNEVVQEEKHQPNPIQSPTIAPVKIPEVPPKIPLEQYLSKNNDEKPISTPEPQQNDTQTDEMSRECEEKRDEEDKTSEEKNENEEENNHENEEKNENESITLEENGEDPWDIHIVKHANTDEIFSNLCPKENNRTEIYNQCKGFDMQIYQMVSEHPHVKKIVEEEEKKRRLEADTSIDNDEYDEISPENIKYGTNEILNNTDVWEKLDDHFICFNTEQHIKLWSCVCSICNFPFLLGLMTTEESINDIMQQQWIYINWKKEYESRSCNDGEPFPKIGSNICGFMETINHIDVHELRLEHIKNQTNGESIDISEAETELPNDENVIEKEQQNIQKLNPSKLDNRSLDYDLLHQVSEAYCGRFSIQGFIIAIFCVIVTIFGVFMYRISYK